MIIKRKIKKGDKVIVIAGKDKGKTGEIITVYPVDKRVIVRGINIVKRHQKPSQSSEGGIVEKELPIHISNIAFLDLKESKATKVGYKNEGGKKVRYCKLSGVVIP